MAKKIMTCKAAPEIELQFDGGEVILLRFDVRCLVAIQEHEGGLKNMLKTSLPEMAALIIYGAGKDINDNFDELKARELVSSLSIENITEIVNTFQESVGTPGNGEEAKKLLAQILEMK